MLQTDAPEGTPSSRSDVHPVDEVLRPHKLAVYGAQHVLAGAGHEEAPALEERHPGLVHLRLRAQRERDDAVRVGHAK